MKIYKNIKCIRNEINIGVSLSRNQGIKTLDETEDCYIMFVNSDDVLMENWYENIKECLEDDEADVWIFSKVVKQNASKEELINYITGNNNLGIYISQPFSKIFKKSFLLENNILFDRNLIYGEDEFFNLECIIKSQKIKISNKSFYRYRRYIGQTTKKYEPKLITSDIYFQNKLYKLLKDNNIKNYDEITKFTIKNAIMIIIRRTKFSNYKEARNDYQKLNQEPYSNITIKQINGKKNKILFLWLRMRLYRILWCSQKIILKTREKMYSSLESFYEDI